MFREEGFPAGEAMATRNRAARLLRSLGWKTDSKTWDSGGLGYGRAFTVRGEKLRIPEEK